MITSRPFLRWLAAWLLPLAASVPPAHAAPDPAIPAPLTPWIPWVLRDAPNHHSPPDASDATARRPVWPSTLDLDASPAAGRFSLNVRVFDAAWFTLPGHADAWPHDVTVGGAPVPVVSRNSQPAIHLQPGIHSVAGSFRWPEIPEKLALPPEIGILRLTTDGKPVDAPDWEPDGTLWLKRSRAAAADRDLLSLKVYRVIEDGIPMWLRTEIELTVSGKSREEILGFALPDGWLPSSISSPLPCALDNDGKLRAQLRPGKWQIAIDAFRTSTADSFAYSTGRTPLAPQELIAFQADPALRVVELRNITAIDVAQTTMPERWRRLPLYLWESQSPFSIDEKMRGMGAQRPPGLKFDRELWLDEDGRGLTWRDRLSGSGQNTWRLDASPGQQLGSVKIDGEGQLITRHPTNKTEGVEVRRRNLNLTATGRSAFSGSLNATGWQANAESLDVNLHLPPGWRLIAAFGPEWSQGDWLTSWSLLDVFMVLILGLAVHRLHNWKTAVLAVVALVLLWKEPNAPRWTWGILVTVAALRLVVPKGRAASILSTLALAAALAFAIITVPFLSRQITGMLHPQVESINPVPFFPPSAPVEYTVSFSANSGDESTESGRAPQQQFAAKSNMAYDSKAKIQTGPAIPKWDWRRVSFGWRGPVTPTQEVRLLLLPVLPQRILTLVRILLLLALAWCLLRPRRSSTTTPPDSLPSPSTTATIALLSCLFLFAPSLSNAQDAPPDAPTPPAPAPTLLDDLRKQLLKTPDAFPGAAEIPLVKLKLEDRALTIEATIHTAADCAVPLPGQLPAWSPLSVSVNGEPAAALARRDGFLWIALPAGVHQLVLRGLLPAGTEWQWTFLLKPRLAEIDAPGWNITGLKPGGIPEAQVFFTRQQAAAGTEAAYDRRDFNAVAAVERHLELGLVWQARTRVLRLSGEGKAVAFQLPLLPGERVLTQGITPINGRIEIRLGAADKEFTWESELPVQPSLTLSAEKGGLWVERWFLETSPVWNVTIDGLAPVFSSNSPDLIPSWNPWPGESVNLAISRPEPVTGETTTVHSVTHTTTVGSQRRTSSLVLIVEASVGRDFPITLEPGADVTSLVHSNQPIDIPVRRDGDTVIIPVSPGDQFIRLEWHSSAPLQSSVPAGRVALPVESSNITQRIVLPEDRWILWVHGPLIGPAVRFWAVLVAAIVFGSVLGGLPFSPFSRRQWILLLTGLTQVPLIAGGGLIAWFFWLAWRGSPSGLRPGRPGFNFSQSLLALGVIPVIAVIAMVLYTGLLGSPSMFLLGKGSYGTTLHWFQARGGLELPRPSVISVSIWVYRGLMLAWSLWLALTLLRMARWAWSQFSAGGLWHHHTPTPAPAPSTSSNPPPPLP